MAHRLSAPLVAAAACACVLVPACGPRVDPADPDHGGESGPAAGPGARTDRPATRDVLIGEMCPKAAAGRPAILPLFLRNVGWQSQAADVTAPLERRSARQFAVLAWDGRRVGVFSVAGASEVDDGVAAVGAFAGASPCEKRSAPGQARELVADCVAAQASCGLAVAVLEPAGGFEARPAEEDPDPPDIEPAGMCVAKGLLLVDVDADGTSEAFPVAGFLDESRGPADEVGQVPAGGATCTPTFAARAVVPPGDPRDWRGMDVVGVADFDGDGRREIVAVYHYAGRRTWALYSATDFPGRLDLVGEAVPWSVR
jgi:hypothetical protein